MYYISYDDFVTIRLKTYSVGCMSRAKVNSKVYTHARTVKGSVIKAVTDLFVFSSGAARHCYTCSTVDGSDENCEDHFTYRENSTVKIDQACDTYCIVSYILMLNFYVSK